MRPLRTAVTEKLHEFLRALKYCFDKTNIHIMRIVCGRNFLNFNCFTGVLTSNSTLSRRVITLGTAIRHKSRYDNIVIGVLLKSQIVTVSKIKLKA